MATIRSTEAVGAAFAAQNHSIRPIDLASRRRSQRARLGGRLDRRHVFRRER